MEDDQAEIKIDPRLKCNVCGESSFTMRAGFFYCQECGTKQEKLREIEVEREFDDIKNVKKQKIQTIKMEKPELTSWECYNYILRGLVEELLSFGAKEELKLMTLQIWAAYLRRLEVAFFNKSYAELPKLGLRFLKRDGKTLYNHVQQKRLKRKRKQSETPIIESAAGSKVLSGREWRKSKRNLDKSTYSMHSATTSGVSRDLSQSSANTSSTGTTGRGIQLRFSSHARKRLKRIMPPTHLEKHERDAEGNLTCHQIRPRVRSYSRAEHAVHTMSIKQVYTILAIALNLVEDKIQLSDLVRFIYADHVGTKNVLQYFPPNIAPYGKELLRDIDFYLYPQKYCDKALRDHTGLLTRFIEINEFIKPDISELVLRYVTDLDLPPIVATFVERLINLLPPQFKTRSPHTYPAYEARAMAYVVFVLKLLFGLDGHKEKLISKAAKRINRKLDQLNDKATPKTTTSHDRHAPLFVWSDWMEYIEMRKIIVSQYNSAFCRQFKQCQSSEQLLEDLAEEQRRQTEEDEHLAEGALSYNNKSSKMKRIFEQFQQKYTEAMSTTTTAAEKRQVAERIEFPPSFTPAHEYFKRILLHCSDQGDDGFRIPEFMRVNHALHTLQPFLESQQLREFVDQHSCQLEVLPMACNSNRCYVGVFRTPIESEVHVKGQLRAKIADFEISEKLWLERMPDEPYTDELVFKTELDNYERKYMKVLQAKARKRRQCENDDEPEGGGNVEQSDELGLPQRSATENVSDEIPISHFLMPSDLFREKIKISRKREPQPDILSLHSIDVFSECDMEPIKNLNLKAPRRRLGSVNLFAGLSHDGAKANNGESLEPTSGVDDQAILSLKQELLTSDDDEAAQTNANKITLVTSKMDCWMLLGSFTALTATQKKILEHKFSRSFFWLLETCAQTIGIDWSMLYEQLLAIELMFIYGIEKLDDFQECIRFRYNNPIKDFNVLVNSYREIW